MCGISSNPRALAQKDREIATLNSTIRRLEAEKVISRRRNDKLEDEVAQAQHTKDAVKSNEESRLREMDKRSGALDTKEYQIQTLKSEARADQATISGLRSALEVSEFKVTNGERLLAETETERDEFEAKLLQSGEENANQARLLDAALEEQTARGTTINVLEELVRKLQQRVNAMSPTKWIPLPESELQNDLTALKGSMRGWTRGVATTTVAPWNGLSAEHSTRLSNSFFNVGVFANGIPAGLGDSEGGPTLFLNALLAHDIYTKVLAAPFSSIDSLEADTSSLVCLYNVLRDFKIPQSTHGGSGSRFTSNSNLNGRSRRSIESEKEVHMWRCQTLRQLTSSSLNPTQAEADLIQARNTCMRSIANSRAQQFLDETVSISTVFIKGGMTADEMVTCLEGLGEVYYQAAQVAYNLWTRKQTFKVSTRADMGPITFDADNALMALHPSVRVDDHRGQLKGQPVTLIVHPLLEVVGTDEGEDFDQEPRVLILAEVWLDSNLPAGARRRRRQPSPPVNPQPTPGPTGPPPRAPPASTGGGSGGPPPPSPPPSPPPGPAPQSPAPQGPAPTGPAPTTDADNDTEIL
jgi:hypothetical protein